MQYKTKPNLLLESLAYLGRKASDNTWLILEDKINKRNLYTSKSFISTLENIKLITDKIDKKVNITDDKFKKLFNNFDGFPFNTIGSYSIAFIIFYPMVKIFDEKYDGNFDKLLECMKGFKRETIAYNIAETLDFLDSISNYSQQKSNYLLTDNEFIDGVLSLSIPAESKVAIFDAYNNFYKYLDEVSIYINKVIILLEKEENSLNEITKTLEDTISSMGCTEYFQSISKLNLSSKNNYCVQPFIFGLDTNITSTFSNGVINIYCGILRKELLEMLNDNKSYIDEIYTAYNLLGDRTRFDIICFLKTKKAYGQELSKHFNLSRNTIHHHMNKLINYGLITCTNDGNRVYYSLDSTAFESLILKQKEIFID